MFGPFLNRSPQWKPASGWYVADPAELASNPMVIHGGRLLPWDRLPRCNPSSIETLRVFAAATTARHGLPSYLLELAQLSAP